MTEQRMNCTNFSTSWYPFRGQPGNASVESAPSALFILMANEWHIVLRDGHGILLVRHHQSSPPSLSTPLAHSGINQWLNYRSHGRRLLNSLLVTDLINAIVLRIYDRLRWFFTEKTLPLSAICDDDCCPPFFGYFWFLFPHLKRLRHNSSQDPALSGVLIFMTHAE